MDLAEPEIIFIASSISLAFKSFIFSCAIFSACFLVMDPTITLPGSLDPPFSFAASFIKCEAGGEDSRPQKGAAEGVRCVRG